MDKNKKIFFMKLNKIHIPKLNKKPALLIPFARCRSHTMSPDLSIVWPLNIRLVLDHPRSSAPGLLLLPWSLLLPIISHLSPTHHETSKCDSPHEQIGVEPLKYPEFKFKQRHVNDSSQSNQDTDNLVSQPCNKSASMPPSGFWCLNDKTIKELMTFAKCEAGKLSYKLH
jgi:hypothetical protein